MAANAGPPAPAPAPLPALPRAAWALLVLVGVAVLLTLVTFPIYDTDLWQHLLVGKVIWTQHRIPHTQEWVWPIHGAPDVLPSWLFRALLYPFWAVGGLAGLTAWRWLTTLVTFGFLWAASRASGARGPWALVALIWCAMLYRYRSQARPETFVAMLIAVQLWLLEKRRAEGVRPGRIDPAWFVVPVALLWANAHISYYIGLFLTGCYWLVAVLPAKGPRAPQAPRTLFGVLLASAAVSFLNPFGWRALAQPFDYFFTWRHEPIYQIIGELQPVDWKTYRYEYLPVFFAALLGLAIASWRRRRFDVVQLLVMLMFIPQALGTQRFLGYLGVLVAPFFARDLDTWCEAIPWRALARPWVRTGIVTGVLLVLPIQTLDKMMSPGIAIVWNAFPVRACDWIAAHDVRGRSFNAFGYGGYMLWRFYPDPGRLPFMDIHQAGTRADRYKAGFMPTSREAWLELDKERHFDYVLMPFTQYPGQHYLDVLDADSTWALVFMDDAGVLYLRRSGPLGPLAERERYHWITAGPQGIEKVGALAYHDRTVHQAMQRELERVVASSPWHGSASNLLANLAFADARWDDARRYVQDAIASDASLPDLHERLGIAEFYGGHPAEALAAYAREKQDNPASKTIDFRIGQVQAALKNRDAARKAYERAVKMDPNNAEARDSLAALDRH